MKLSDYSKKLNLDGYGKRIHFQAPLLGYSKLCKDAKKYNYWDLEDSDWDKQAQTDFDNGQVTINNCFTPDRLLMKISQFANYLKCSKIITNYDEWSKIEKAVQDEMIEESDAIEKSGTLENGYMFYIGVADGSATYRVVKHTPKSVWVELRKFGDGYMDQVLGVECKLSMQQFKRLGNFASPYKAMFG